MSPDAIPSDDILDIDVPEPNPEAIDESVVRALMGSDRLEQARLGSVAGQQRQIIALLRQQVAGWKARYEAIAPKDEEAEGAPSVLDEIPDPVCADPEEHPEPEPVAPVAHSKFRTPMPWETGG